MKKLIKMLTVVLAICMLTASLVACGGNGDNETVAVTGITLNNATLSLIVPQTETLTATVAPSNASVKTITWSSSKPEFATVSTSGLVSAVAAGTATITATSTADNTKVGSCVVTVTAAAVAPTAVDTYTAILDTDSKYMLLSNADEVNAGESATFTLAANIGHSVDDAVVKYNGVSLTKVNNAAAVYTSVKNAFALAKIVPMSSIMPMSEVVYANHDEVKYVTYELASVASDFDPSLLTVEQMTKTYKLILDPANGGFYYADMNGNQLCDGLYGYDGYRPIYYVEVPVEKAYKLRIVTTSGYGLGDTSGVNWYNQDGSYGDSITGTDFSGTVTGHATWFKSCVVEIAPQEMPEFKISASGIMPSWLSAELDALVVAMGSDASSAFTQNPLRATSTGETSFEVCVPQNGNLYLYPLPIGKYECTIKIEIDNVQYDTFANDGEFYHYYGPIAYVGQDIDVILYLTNDGQDFTYTLHITSPKPVQEQATSLIDIQAGSAKYSINSTDFASVAKATSSADLSGITLDGFTATFATSTALNENHIILTATSACGITLDDGKAIINIFIQQSGFYVQDFLWASADDFEDKVERIDVSEKVELTPTDGKLSIFYYAFGITLEIVIAI